MARWFIFTLIFCILSQSFGFDDSGLSLDDLDSIIQGGLENDDMSGYPMRGPLLGGGSVHVKHLPDLVNLIFGLGGHIVGRAGWIVHDALMSLTNGLFTSYYRLPSEFSAFGTGPYSSGSSTGYSRAYSGYQPKTFAARYSPRYSNERQLQRAFFEGKQAAEAESSEA